MKHRGSTFEYERQRNENLLRAYRQLLGEAQTINLDDIYDRLVMMPADRFWVSEERAAIVISSMLRGNSLHGMRQNNIDKYNEIFRRVVELRKQYPDASVYDLTCMVCKQPAPKFYLTAGSARVIICKAKKKWQEERKRKLRYLF